MKIWIDVLTPKQLLFAEPLIKKLKKNNDLLCTSRKYNEVTKLTKIRNLDLIFVGKHGGSEKESKLRFSINRMNKLLTKIKKFEPDITISFCSPEAARVSFGLGIKHIAFCDSPHADAVMRLTLPLIQKLLIPNVIPKKEFTKYGIEQEKIIPYNAIDAFVTIQRRYTNNTKLPFENNQRKNILIRIEEEEAAYASKSKIIIPIIKKIIKDHKNENIVVLGRYKKQIQDLKEQTNRKIKIVEMSFDGKYLLKNTDIFIGSGGTMTAEAALMGIPTISYNAVPNIIEKFLVKKTLVKREIDPKKISRYITKIFQSTNDERQIRAKEVIQEMEDPIEKLIKIIKE